MSLIGPWETTLQVEGPHDAELEVQMKGEVHFVSQDYGLEIENFEWTLEGAEIPEPATSTLASAWSLEEHFLEDVWANIYTRDDIRVGRTYVLVRGAATAHYPTRVEVLAVCKIPNEIRWMVVGKSVALSAAIRGNPVQLFPVSDFYVPGSPDDECGPRYRLEPLNALENLPQDAIPEGWECARCEGKHWYCIDCGSSSCSCPETMKGPRVVCEHDRGALRARA